MLRSVHRCRGVSVSLWTERTSSLLSSSNDQHSSQDGRRRKHQCAGGHNGISRGGNTREDVDSASPPLGIIRLERSNEVVAVLATSRSRRGLTYALGRPSVPRTRPQTQNHGSSPKILIFVREEYTDLCPRDAAVDTYPFVASSLIAADEGGLSP